MSEVHLPAFCSRHLKLLKYPHSIASVWNVQQCVVCVKWLEDEIFRVLPPAKRDWLGDRNGWEANASSYLEKLHLKMKLDVTAQDGGFSRCLPLMICRAVEEMTADSLYGMDDDSTRVENPTIPIHSDMLSESANSESTQFINTVIGCEDFPPPTLAEAIKVLHCRFGAVDTQSELSSEAIPNSFAKICRLCATESLAEEQMRSSRILADFQRITANPKTENRAGRVGI